MNIHESAEDYLEAILMLCKQHGSARSVDIAARLGVSKPSVSFAMKKLRENGYILMGDDNRITLTALGSSIANRMLERHRLRGMLWLTEMDQRPVGLEYHLGGDPESPENFKKWQEIRFNI